MHGDSNVEKVMKKVDKKSPEYVALSFFLSSNEGDEKKILSYVHSIKWFNIYHISIKKHLLEKKDKYDLEKQFEYELMKKSGNSQKVRIQVREKKTGDLANIYYTVYKIEKKWWLYVPKNLIKKK